MSQQIRGYLPTLDGWRAIAVLGVVAYHLTYQLPLPHSLPLVLNQCGQKGVDLFFGLSGLLITSRMLEEYRERGFINLKQFYIRRATRILPPSLTYLVVIGILGAAGIILVSPVAWVAALLFARNYLVGTWYEGHYWSLAVEEHFYIFWPGVLALMGRRRAAWVAASVCLLVAIWRALLWFPFFNPRGEAALFYRTEARLDALLCGALVAILLERYPDQFRAFLKPVFALPALAISFCLLIGVTGPVNSLARLGQAAIIPFVLVSTVLYPESQISVLLEARWLRWVGRLSYSLYLWQQLFLGHGVNLWPLRLAAVFAAASASYYLVERPAMRLGHRLARPTTEGRADLLQTPEPREPEGQALLAEISVPVGNTTE